MWNNDWKKNTDYPEWGDNDIYGHVNNIIYWNSFVYQDITLSILLTCP